MQPPMSPIRAPLRTRGKPSALTEPRTSGAIRLAVRRPREHRGRVLGKWFQNFQIRTEAATRHRADHWPPRLVLLTAFGVSSRPPSPLFEKALEVFAPHIFVVEVLTGPVRKLRVLTFIDCIRGTD